MPIHRRLERPEIYRVTSRISRKWKKLPFPEFIIQVLDEMNPDKTNDVDDNCSYKELGRGWMSPKPLSHINRQGDLRLFIDQLGRFDAYALKRLKQIVEYWNKRNEKALRQIVSLPVEVEEIYPATSHRPERRKTVIYDFVKVLRGVDAVRYIEQRERQMIHGHELKIDRIQHCSNTRAVDKEIEAQLRENQEIQNGR